MSTAFRAVMDKLKTGATEMRSTAVSMLPVSVKNATIDLCNAIKVGAPKIWKAIEAGSKELYSIIKKAWASVLSYLSKVFDVMYPLLSTGQYAIKRGAEITSDLSKRVLKGVKSSVIGTVKAVRTVKSHAARLLASRSKSGQGKGMKS